MYSKGDFHLHTNASDGKLTPKDLVAKACEESLDIIAITDHDTTNGVTEAIEEGCIVGIKVLPGIELSTLHNGESIHILGFFRDDEYKNVEFQNFLTSMHDYRIWRAKKIVDNLKKFFDIKIDFDKLLNAAEGVIARPHIAQAIIDAGYNYDWKYIFENIIGKDSPAYVPNKKISVPEGIQKLKEMNAIVVLAHPVLIKNSSITNLLEFDFDGIEAIYSMNNPEDTQKLIQIADSHEKIITAGSDFHGLGRHDVSHGYIGSTCLEGERLRIFVDKLKSC